MTTAIVRGVKPVALLFACTLALVPATLAHADDGDSAYLFNMQTLGVPAGSPAAEAAYGRQLCDRLPASGFDALVAAVNQENASGGLTMHQSAMVIGSAISSFCLDRSYILPHDLKY